MTKEGEEKMSTDKASVHDKQSREAAVKLGTDHPANLDESAKEGEEKMSTELSGSTLSEPEADTKMEEEDPEYEEDPEDIEIYEDDEDMDDGHAEEPTAELWQRIRITVKEAKLEVAAEDGGNKQSLNWKLALIFMKKLLRWRKSL
ncbi:unnamed protein product [Urochloa humidicola]